MRIKELLKQDFDLELDIAGGTGNSKDDPIYVLSQTEQEASLTEWLVLRGLGKGREVLWRTLSVEYVPGTSVIQRKIETKELLEKEIITRVANYYFLRKNADLYSSNIKSVYVVQIDKELGIEYPYELSWLHYEGIKNYSDQGRADLGYSLSYNALGIKATIYVYPKVCGDTEKDVLELELDAVVAEIKSFYGADEIKHDWGVNRDVDYIFYAYISKHDSKITSVILIMRKGNCFVKLRYSFIDEPVMREIANDFKNSFVSLLRK